MTILKVVCHDGVKNARKSAGVFFISLIMCSNLLTTDKGGKMKKILKSSVIAAAVLGCGATGAMAGLIADTPPLYDWAFNIDGTVTTDAIDNYSLVGMPVNGALDPVTNLGTLTWSTNAAGAHSFLAFFDYEIDESTNGFSNESGSTQGTPSAGQTWEIDEPGFVFGDIYTNLHNNSLDNINAIPAGSEEDVSMAMGWDFILAAGDIATITLTLTDLMPQSVFYLAQFDPESQKSIYFTGDLVIQNGNPEIPEPATLLLMGTGLAALFGGRRKRKV